MKNIRKGILAICAAVVMAFSVTACTQKAESAYDLAVKNGTGYIFYERDCDNGGLYFQKIEL